MSPSSPQHPPPPPASGGRLLVLYASQTGHAEEAAGRVGREAERGGCPAVHVLSMDSFDPRRLPGESFVVFVVSTAGQGDPPDSMKGFWRYLLKKNLDARWLQGFRYAVFGLGDSGYQDYNVAAKKLCKRLSQLGATKPIIGIGLGDDQASSGYEKALGPWLLSLWKSLNRTNPSLLPRIPDIINPNLNNLGDAKVEVIYYSSDDTPQDSIVSDSKKLIGRVRSVHPALKFHNDGEPHYMLKMVTNQRLTRKDPERDVRHFELEDTSSAVRYQVGDALEILPSQNLSAVNAFIKRCNLDPDCYISIRAKGGDEVSKGSPVNGLMDRIKLKTFVALTMDVASASPGRYFYEDIGNKKYLMEDITRVPDVKLLGLGITACGHSFGASLFHVLRMCTAIRRLNLGLIVAPEHEAETVCPSGCICDQPSSWKTRELVLNCLEEVEVFDLKGSEHEISAVNRLFSWAPVLKRMTVNFHYSVTENKAEELCQVLLTFSRPEICMIYRMPDMSEKVLYA